MGGHRLTAWNHPINAFLPMALNPQHATRALARLPHHISAIMPQAAGPTARGSSPHSALLLIMAKAMNNLVVEMVTAGNGSGSSSSSSGTSRHMSDAALSVFCHLHHLLLSVALQQPSVVEEARTAVTHFLQHPSHRTKRHCPDLGVLLIELLLVPCDEVPWAQFAPAFLRELLARQVLWAQREHGRAFTDDLLDAPEHRLAQHFSAARTSLRVVALEVWFANALARPAQAHTASLQQELANLKSAYDRTEGRPTATVFARFNAHSRAVLTHSSWLDFLRSLRLDLRAPSATAVQSSGGSEAAAVGAMWANVLRQAVCDSHSRGYHRSELTSPAHYFEPWNPAELPVLVTSEKW